jgi:hypothetical protein
MGIKAHPPATLSPVSRRARRTRRRSPDTRHGPERWQSGYPRRGCAPRIQGFERPPAVGALSALRLDQAQANQRDDLSLIDQHEQVHD